MEVITLSHGSGGKQMHQLIQQLFYKYFENEILMQQNDASLLPPMQGKIAVTTDSFVVSPIFFPGGDIGKLSICGTVNDLAMSGAVPLYITVGFILEEGLPVETLEKIVQSMAETAKRAGVKIVAGDTKVVEKGSCDQIYINTTGIGLLTQEIYIGGDCAKPSDKVIVSGTLGDHGVCILSKRNNMDFEVDVQSDCGLLSGMIAEILSTGAQVKVLRDPTRGGAATTLGEIAKHSGQSILLYEEKIPVKDQVMSLCEIVGWDPLYIANEGKLIVIVKAEDADKVLKVMKQHSMGQDAAIIGEVLEENKGTVYIRTEIGGTRIVSIPEGELLPRIC